MYGNQQMAGSSAVQELRRSAGRLLREMREAAGLSQRELAERVGLEYYTFVSQLETGRGRIPPDRYRAWADALGVPPRDFVQMLMRFYDPVTWEILFADDEPALSMGGASAGERERYAAHRVMRDA